MDRPRDHHFSKQRSRQWRCLVAKRPCRGESDLALLSRKPDARSRRIPAELQEPAQSERVAAGGNRQTGLSSPVEFLVVEHVLHISVPANVLRRYSIEGQTRFVDPELTLFF